MNQAVKWVFVCLSSLLFNVVRHCGVYRQDDKDIQDPAAGTYYLVILAYVLPGFALLMLLVHLITWRQKLGQLRKDADGQQSLYYLLILLCASVSALRHLFRGIYVFRLRPFPV